MLKKNNSQGDSYHRRMSTWDCLSVLGRDCVNCVSALRHSCSPSSVITSIVSNVPYFKQFYFSFYHVKPTPHSVLPSLFP